MSDALTAEDRLEIKQVLMLWGQYEDRGDAEGWAGLFTPDGRSTSSNGRVIEGRDALVAASRARRAKPESRLTVHWMGDAVITGNREQAEVGHYCMVLEQGDAGLGIKSVSERSYLFVRHEGAWRIRTRTYQPLPQEFWAKTSP